MDIFYLALVILAAALALLSLLLPLLPGPDGKRLAVVPRPWLSFLIFLSLVGYAVYLYANLPPNKVRHSVTPAASVR